MGVINVAQLEMMRKLKQFIREEAIYFCIEIIYYCMLKLTSYHSCSLTWKRSVLGERVGQKLQQVCGLKG